MPLETAEALAERLFVLTLALSDAQDPQDLGSLFAERARLLRQLEERPLPDEALAKLAKVQQAERQVLQDFARTRAEIVRDLAGHAMARRLPQTYASARRGGRHVDSAT